MEAEPLVQSSTKAFRQKSLIVSVSCIDGDVSIRVSLRYPLEDMGGFQVEPDRLKQRRN